NPYERSSAARPYRAAYPISLQEAAQKFALDPQADDLARPVDLVDRVGGDEAALAREPSGADGQSVGDVRLRSVHRRLDSPDEATAVVGHEVAARPAEVVGKGAHRRNLLPRL